MKTPEEMEDWAANCAQSFEAAFVAGKYGQAALSAEQIYTVLNLSLIHISEPTRH